MSYGFVHNDHRHLATNVVSQLFIGLPLELTNGWGRIAMIYLSGIFLGGLGREFTEHMDRPMAGASGNNTQKLISSIWSNFISIKN